LISKEVIPKETITIKSPLKKTPSKEVTSQKTPSKKSSTKNPTRKILFKHGRAIGDALMFTSGIRDFKLLFPSIHINVESNFAALWENNPYLDRSIKYKDPGVEFHRVGYPIINNCNNSYMHFTAGFLYDMIAAADAYEPLPMSIGEFTAVFAGGEVGDYDGGISNGKVQGKLGELKKKYGTRRHQGGLKFIPEDIRKKAFGNQDKFNSVFGRQWADIHLTEKEKSYSLIEDLYGEDVKYWVVAPGGKTDCTCKIWDWRRFQDVIDHFDGLIKFVTIGRGDHIVEKFKNTIDLTDKFNDNIRGLIQLVYHSEGCVTGVTFLMHLAAAVPPQYGYGRKPCVSIYGGRENTSFTWYCNHQILHTNGAFDCCSAGGCWNSRVIPIPTSPSRNTRLCTHPVKVDGKTIPSCMDVITSGDVIRGIEKYYDGNLYTYMKRSNKPVVKIKTVKKIKVQKGKRINLLASLSTKGGGEQSSLMIAKVLRDAGWQVNFHSWDKIHQNYAKEKVSKWSFKNKMLEHMETGIPLLFYANDQIQPFLDHGQEVVEKSSMLIVGINYINAGLPKCRWLDKTGKLKAVIFQNQEKKLEYLRDQIGQENTKLVVLFGAINLDKYYELSVKKRESRDEPFVVLKHSMPDSRKYVTQESLKGGEKIHLWQKKYFKELDVDFYKRLLKDTRKNVRFEFMEAHPELVKEFGKDNPRMIFHAWDSMDVGEFLERGHCYLYRTSNKWRDQLPRTLLEGMCVGLCPIVEPRDGPYDRIQYGRNGMYFCHYDEALLHLKTLERKTDLCYSLGNAAKQSIKKNYDPKMWVDIIEELCFR